MQELNETANKVLDVAERHTQTRGFNAFSYKDIQNEVGVKTSSIHYYFPTKQDLAITMTERYIERFSRMLAELAQRHKSGLERLEALGEAFMEVQKEGKFCLCGMLASDMAALSNAVSGKLREFFELNEQWISKAITLAKQQGDVGKAVDPASAAAHFLSSLEGGMLIARTQKNSRYLEAIIQEALARLKP